MGCEANIWNTLVRGALLEITMRPLSPFGPPIPYICSLTNGLGHLVRA